MKKAASANGKTILLTVFFAAFLIIGLFYLTWTLNAWSTFIETKAVVIWLNQEWSDEPAFPVFQFIDPRNGETIIAQSKFGSKPPAYHVGDIVNILFDPTNPTNIISRSLPETLLPIVFTALGGLGLLFTSRSLILSMWRKPRSFPVEKQILIPTPATLPNSPDERDETTVERTSNIFTNTHYSVEWQLKGPEDVYEIKANDGSLRGKIRKELEHPSKTPSSLLKLAATTLSPLSSTSSLPSKYRFEDKDGILEGEITWKLLGTKYEVYNAEKSLQATIRPTNNLGSTQYQMDDTQNHQIAGIVGDIQGNFYQIEEINGEVVAEVRRTASPEKYAYDIELLKRDSNPFLTMSYVIAMDHYRQWASQAAMFSRRSGSSRRTIVKHQ